MGTVLTVGLVLVVGVVTYALTRALLKPVYLLGACLLAVSVATLVVKNRELIFRHSFGRSLSASADRESAASPDAANDSDDRRRARYQKISQQDHEFLEEVLREQNQEKPKRSDSQTAGKDSDINVANKPAPRAELVTNSKRVKRAELVNPNTTVKRAE